MHVEFGKVIKSLADTSGNELSAYQLFQAFEQEYLVSEGPYELAYFQTERTGGLQEKEAITCLASLAYRRSSTGVRGRGNGPIDAFVHALNEADIAGFKLLSYTEHSLGQGSDARAAAYIQIQTDPNKLFFGSAIEDSSELAAVKAVLSALIAQAHRSLPFDRNQEAIVIFAKSVEYADCF